MTPGSESKAPVTVVAPDASSIAQLSVAGMHCGSCAALIEETLGDQSGVLSASVDLDQARAVVEYEPSTIDIDTIRAAIAEAGYSATPIA
jgi:Cu+-exporting ATPase